METTTVIFVITLVFLVAIYLKIIRPWQLHWGARAEESKRSMPGDDIVSKPSFNATRAVTINASPENIYPWIVQMGVNRAGWYSYDLLDNLARKSAESKFGIWRAGRLRQSRFLHFMSLLSGFHC